MARSKSSARWLTRQTNDPYVSKAKSQGYRSRAVFKLEEIQNKYNILQSKRCIVDLGAAPGAWSQYVINATECQTIKVVALDILAMDPIPGVCVIQGDFTELDTLEQLVNVVQDAQPDLVLSDMAPNISGNKAVDQPRSMYLAELALEFATQHLNTGGSFVVKLFQGSGYSDYIVDLRSYFKQVNTFKPKASRKESKEMYALARGFEL